MWPNPCVKTQPRNHTCKIRFSGCRPLPLRAPSRHFFKASITIAVLYQIEATPPCYASWLKNSQAIDQTHTTNQFSKCSLEGTMKSRKASFAVVP
jgi:hypothetical protein